MAAHAINPIGAPRDIVGAVMRRLLLLTGVATLGIAVCVLVAQLNELTMRRMLLLAAGGAAVVMVLAARQVWPALLAGFVLSLTYVRSYYSFGQVGSLAELYWIPADLLLLLLLCVWGYEMITHRVPAAAGPRLWMWFLPFAVICVVSSLQATHVDRAMPEVLRILKLGVILIFLRFHMRRNEWLICAAALGMSVFVQSAYGILQATTEMFATEALGGESWSRAMGTLLHPNMLSSYLLLSLPLFVTLSVAIEDARLKTVCTVIAITGSLGLVCTLSRWSFMMAAIQAAIIGVGLVMMQYVRVKRFAGIVVVCGVLALVGMMPFLGLVVDRFSTVGEAIDFRVRYNETALAMFSQEPYFGVGLNNFMVRVIEHDPYHEALLKTAEEEKENAARVLVVVHNLYLLVLSETGVFGLLAFLLFVGGALYNCLRALHDLNGVWRAAALGLLAGLVGVMGQMLADYSLWMDPLLYTFGVVFVMLNNLRSVGNTAAAPH